MIKYIFIAFLLCQWFEWHPWRDLPYNKKIIILKERDFIIDLLKTEKKVIFFATISLIFTIFFCLVDWVFCFLLFIAPGVRFLYKEFKRFLTRLYYIRFTNLFVLYLIPALSLSFVLWYRHDETWEIALKRITPEAVQESLFIIVFSIVIVLLMFALFHDNAKNDIVNRALGIIYGTGKPHERDHWFLHFCYWLHPETYAVARYIDLLGVYLLYIHGLFYYVLGFYAFKGVFF